MIPYWKFAPGAFSTEKALNLPHGSLTAVADIATAQASLREGRVVVLASIIITAHDGEYGRIEESHLLHRLCHGGIQRQFTLQWQDNNPQPVTDDAIKAGEVGVYVCSVEAGSKLVNSPVW